MTKLSFSTQPPATLEVVAGGTLSATVLATGFGTIKYAWYTGSPPTTKPTTTPIAKTPTLTINNVSFGNEGGYYVVATTEYGDIVASTLMKVIITLMPVFLYQPPSTLSVVLGGTIWETVSSLGNGIVNYAWYRGSVPTTNPTTKAIATTATLTITHVTKSDAGGYYAVATNEYNNIVASTLMTVVITNSTMMLFTQQPPTTLAVITGGTVQETVQATGSGIITYTWYRGLNPSTSPGTIPISKTDTLTITDVTSSNAGGYYAIAASDYGYVAASTLMTVTVITVLTITTQPASVSVKAGKVATFTVVTSGGLAPYTYTWYQNGKVVSGATTATYTITSPTKAMNAAQIYAKISDSYTTPQIVTSSTATLTVKSSSTWWLWALIAAVVVVVVIIIIVVIIIVIHHKKSTKTTNTPNIPIQQPVPPPVAGVGQPNYGFASTGFNPTLY